MRLPVSRPDGFTLAWDMLYDPTFMANYSVKRTRSVNTHDGGIRSSVRALGSRARQMALGSALLFAFAAPAAQASTSTRGSLTITVRGLPTDQPAAVVVNGPRYRRVVSAAHASLTGLQPGVYVLTLRPVAIRHTTGRVVAGATAYPAKGRLIARVRSGRTTRLMASYSGVVNPTVESLPSPLLGVVGNPDDPLGVVLPASARVPAVGTIFTSAPDSTLPYGLISRVTSRTRQAGLLLVSLKAVPIVDATPELSFQGSLSLEPAVAAAASAHAASNCSSPSLLNFSAHLDSVEVRRAFLGAWPPQLELTVAVRTTEALGVSAAALGINCDWTIAELGPYQEAIPVGPIVVPVYATFPVQAGIHINGTLNVGTFNVASTTVAAVAAGGDYNEASLTQQGSNVWLTGSPSLSGSAKLSASIGVQAGIGVAKAANVHLQANFGPELDWTSGQACKLLVDMGSLSAGVSVFDASLNTPSFTPLQVQLWTGCHAAAPPPTSGSGPGPSTPPATPTSPPTQAPTPPTPTPAPPAPRTFEETPGPGGVATFTDYHDAGGAEGPRIPQYETVQVTCRIEGFEPADHGIPDNWWYEIASSPWDNAYYAYAEPFYNNGQTSGSLVGTPAVDTSVPIC